MGNSVSSTARGSASRSERAALGVDVAGSPVGEELVVAALEVGALRSAGEDFHVLQVVGRRARRRRRSRR